MNKYLWSFCWDHRRMGKVEGLFIATEEEIANLIGKDVYFGEVLGKHSEVSGSFEEREIVKRECSPEVVIELEKIFGKTICGYNPLHYITEEEVDEYEIDLDEPEVGE